MGPRGGGEPGQGGPPGDPAHLVALSSWPTVLAPAAPWSSALPTGNRRQLPAVSSASSHGADFRSHLPSGGGGRRAAEATATSARARTAWTGSIFSGTSPLRLLGTLALWRSGQEGGPRLGVYTAVTSDPGHIVTQLSETFEGHARAPAALT